MVVFPSGSNQVAGCSWVDKHLPSSAGSSGVRHKGEGGQQVWRQKDREKGWLVQMIHGAEKKNGIHRDLFSTNEDKLYFLVWYNCDLSSTASKNPCVSYTW